MTGALLMICITHYPRSADVYRLAKQMRRDNQDVMGEKPIKKMMKAYCH